MGTNNDDQEDDFTDPDGNVLSQGSSANEEQIFNYGKECTLSSIFHWKLSVQA